MHHSRIGDVGGRFASSCPAIEHGVRAHLLKQCRLAALGDHHRTLLRQPANSSIWSTLEFMEPGEVHSAAVPHAQRDSLRHCFVC